MAHTNITIDLNRVTRAQFREFMARLIDPELNAEEKDRVTAELGEIVIVEWPYDKPITADGIMSLGLVDNKHVDEALTAAILELNSKN